MGNSSEFARREPRPIVGESPAGRPSVVEVEHAFADDDRIAADAAMGELAIVHAELELDGAGAAHLVALAQGELSLARQRVARQQPDQRRGGGAGRRVLADAHARAEHTRRDAEADLLTHTA